MGTGMRRGARLVLLVLVALVELSTGAGRASAATTVTLTWSQLAPATSPPARDTSASAYDTATGSTVLFGGAITGNPDVALNDTWTWNGTTWTQQSPVDSPSARYGEAMAYDAATGTVVLFGGSQFTGTQYLSDTWTWNGTNWTEQSPAQSPPPMYEPSMAYDAQTQTVVLFGGQNATQNYGDTWSWNGTTWTELSPATSPSARYGAAMTYDSVSGLIELFGGYNSTTNTTYDDTWTWDGATWTQAAPAASPPGRFFSSLVYDPVADVSMLYGGDGASGGLDDTWIYDGTTWTELSSAAAPPARAVFTMNYDPVRQEVILFGGYGTADLADTWVALLQLPQVVTVRTVAPAPATVGATYRIAASGGASGNPVTFSVDPSSTAGACTISGSTVHFTGAGSCVIDAAQAGNNAYLSGAASQTVAVEIPATTTTRPSATTTMAPSTTTTSTTVAPTTTSVVPTTAHGAASSDQLAATGSQDGGLVVAGLVLLLLGAGLVVVARTLLPARRATKWPGPPTR